jgi:hypothetical protein
MTKKTITLYTFLVAVPLTAFLIWPFGNISSWFADWNLYGVYKTFFSWVGDKATLEKMPQLLIDKLDQYYDNNLKDIRYGYTSKFKDLAMTDCYNIYFGDKKMIDAIKNNNMSDTQTRWLLHELAHTEQCYKIKGRNNYAKMWFKQMASSIKPPYTSDLIKKIHDKMPMEVQADAKRDAVWLKIK